MHLCHCGKEFETANQLKGHKSSHNRTENYRATRKKPVIMYNCLYCGKETCSGSSKFNKFCSVECSGKFQWENISIPNIENGVGGNYKRYIKEKRGDLCSECGQLPVWNNKPLVLQLDHIDGNSDNNNLDNLRLLCPNCHTQTETYGSKGQGNRYKKVSKRNTYLQEYKAGLV